MAENKEYQAGTGGAVAMVVVGDGVHVRSLAAYVDALRAARLLARFDGEYLFNSRPIEILEGGPPPDRVTLMSRFPCREALEGFWNSADYQQRIKPLRANAGRLDVGMWRLRTRGIVRAEEPVYFMGVAPHVDTVRWAAYAQAVQASGVLARHGGEPIVFGAPLATLEGELAPDRVTIVIRFPRREAVHAFWHSAEYREIRKLREGAGELVAGVWRGF